MLFNCLPGEDEKPCVLNNECATIAGRAQKICARSGFGLLSSPWETLFIAKLRAGRRDSNIVSTRVLLSWFRRQNPSAMVMKFLRNEGSS